MLRNLFAALLLATVSTCAPTAPAVAVEASCAPVKAEPFTRHVVDIIQAGKMPGIGLQGAHAIAFASDAGVDDPAITTVLASFLLLGSSGSLFLLVVSRGNDGVELACIGVPGDGDGQINAAIRKHFGVGA